MRTLSVVVMHDLASVLRNLPGSEPLAGPIARVVTGGIVATALLDALLAALLAALRLRCLRGSCALAFCTGEAGAASVSWCFALRLRLPALGITVVATAIKRGHRQRRQEQSVRRGRSQAQLD